MDGRGRLEIHIRHPHRKYLVFTMAGIRSIPLDDAAITHVELPFNGASSSAFSVAVKLGAQFLASFVVCRHEL